MSKNVDDVISGPALDKPKDEISEYYKRIDEKLSKAQMVLEAAIDAGAPRKVVDVLRDWRDDCGNTGD